MHVRVCGAAHINAPTYVRRDGRIRRHLGVRYDARDGAFDWDYHMRLAEMVSVYVYE